MAEIYISELSSSPIVSDKVSGTGTKRFKIYLNGTASATDTLSLGDYFKGMTSVEGVESYYEESLAGSTSTGTALSWTAASGTIVTFSDTGTIHATLVAY